MSKNRQVITGLLLAGYLVLLTLGARTSSRLVHAVLIITALGALVYQVLERRARLASARCPHDNVPLMISYRLPRSVLTCPVCERRYAMYGPQLYESKPSH